MPESLGRAQVAGAVSIRCPKCKGATFTLYERLEVADCFPVCNGVAQPRHPDENMPGQIGFTAHCSCGHDWVPRNTSAMAVIDAEAEFREASRG